MEAVKSVKFAKSVELVESTESVELIESVKLVESVKLIESVELIESTKSVELIESTESIELSAIVYADLKRALATTTPAEPIASGGTANGFVAGEYFLKKSSRSEDGEKFKYEAGVLVKLCHLNIIKCYGFIYIDTIPTVVLEIGGKDLFDHIHVGSTLPVDMASDILMQLLNGVAYLHQHGIIHADLKPENILIDKNGCVKIIDFGGAITKKSKKFSSVTPGYMAPEVFIAMQLQIMPDELNLSKLDTWSIGAILYNMTNIRFHLFEDLSNGPQIKNLIYFEWIEYLKRHPTPDLSISLFTQTGNGHVTDKFRRPQTTKNIMLLCSLLSLYPENRPSAIEAIKLLEKYPLY